MNSISLFLFLSIFGYAIAQISVTCEAGTCKPASGVTFCSSYFPSAGDYCSSNLNTGNLSPESFDASARILAGNSTYIAEFATELGATNANSAGCQSFIKAMICIEGMGTFTPPCSTSNNDVTLACFSSCINGFNACGVSATTGKDECDVFVETGLFAAEGQSNCYAFSTGFALSYNPVFLFFAFLAISLYWM